MGKTFLKICLFMLAVVSAFVWVANSIPQVVPQRGPAAEDMAKLNALAFVEAGKAIFEKNCTQCHAVGDMPATRCPNLSGVGSRAAARAALPGNRGRLTDGVSYLTESLYEPKAFLVEDYPAIMPIVY